MPTNTSYPDLWVGHSQWRTLISLEGEVISRITDDAVGHSGLTLNTVWPNTQTGRVFHICPVTGLDACVFFLAGRSFLINSPEGSFEALTGMTQTMPSTIILLSWEDRYIDGLLEYCYAYSKLPQAQKLEIYTSDWGWDSIKNRAWNQLISGEKHQEKASFCKFFLNAIEPDSVSTESSKPLKIVPHLFKKNIHYRLFPQIEWWLNYSLAPSPCLQVRFRLFDSYLTVTHHEPYPAASYQEQILARIIQAYPSAINELQRVIGRRLEDLIHIKSWEKTHEGSKFNLHPSFYTYNLFSKKLKCKQKPLDPKSFELSKLLPRQLRNNEFDLKTIASDWKRSARLPNLISAKALNWQEVETSIEEAAKANAADRIFLAISCGGFSVISSGQITPITRVSINNMNLSLLGFKLYDFLKDQNSQQPVFQKKLILLVSPWTEANVRREISHLLWTFKNEFEIVLQPEDIIYLRQTVVPRCIEENEQLKYYEEDGFQFNPSGHFDFLKSLMEDNEDMDAFFEPPVQNRKKSSGSVFIYYTTYKNLGRNIDEKVGLLAQYMAIGHSPTLLFELARHDSEKGVGSYWVEDGKTSKNKKWLTKPVYHKKKQFKYGAKSEGGTPCKQLFIEKPTSSAHLLMSTASFLVNLDQLRQSKAKLKRLHFFSSYQLPLRSASMINQISSSENVLLETLQFERDIDQITEQIPCAGVEVETDEQGITPRFVPIKKEKDLYQSKMEVLKKIWQGEHKKNAVFQQSLPQHIPYLLEPDEKHDTWGGRRIRDAKALPGIDEKVSETWEASLHHKGVSGIKYDALNSVPLSTFLKDSDLDVMFKLLDCNSWLSIQLHPSHSTCKTLTRHLSHIEQEFMAANWDRESLKTRVDALNNREDNDGKEELFYIADNRNYLTGEAQNEANLILGLHKEKLKELSFLSEAEWGHYRQLFQKAIAPDDCGYKKFREEKIEESAFARIETFISGPTAVLAKKYKERFAQLADEHLPFILRIREEMEPTSLLNLQGILFLFSLQSIKECLQELKTVDLKIAFSKSELPLFDFFYKTCPKPGAILQVKPGMLHALGKGLFAVEASNRSNNTFRIFDHGREFSPSPRPLHYLLAAVSLSNDSFVSRKNESRYIFPYKDFDSKDNICLKVFSPDKLRKLRNIKFPEKEGLLILCTKGVLRITTTYKQLETDVPYSTILDLKSAYTAYIPPVSIQFERKVTVTSNGYAEAECVVVSAIAQRREAQHIAVSNKTATEIEALKPITDRAPGGEYLDKEEERIHIEATLGFYT